MKSGSYTLKQGVLEFQVKLNQVHPKQNKELEGHNEPLAGSWHWAQACGEVLGRHLQNPITLCPVKSV